MVEQRELEQWFLRITNYADELVRDLDKLQGWPEKVRTMQRNWIGRSEGAMVDFKLDGAAGPAGDKITVFTTRIDTIYGATSLQLAPEHPMVTDLIANNPELLAKVEDMMAQQRKAKEAGDIGTIEKRGFFTERYALNPFNGEKRSHLGRELRPDGLRYRRDHVGARARRARLRVRQEIRSGHQGRHLSAPRGRRC